MDSTVNRRGRKLHKITEILKRFFRGKASVPKKDNFTLCIMRKFIKVLRSMVKNKYPKLYGLEFDIKVENQCLKWDQLTKLYRKNQEIIKSASETSNSPLTESRSKNELNRQNQQKTFNRTFNGDFFSNIVIKDAFRIFLNLIFDHEYCNGLCKEFKFSCCKIQGNTHTEECKEKWMGLKNYYFYDFFYEIGVEELEKHNQGCEEDVDLLLVDFNRF